MKRLAVLINADNAFLVVVGALATGFLTESFGLNAMAAAFPKLVSTIVLFLIAYVLVGRIVAVARGAVATLHPAEDEPAKAEEPATIAAPAQTEEPAKPGGPSRGRTMPWFLMFLFTLLYPLLMSLVGFPATTLVFVTAVALLLGLRGIRGLLFGALSTAVLVLLFQYVLKVPLPDGSIWEILFRS